MKAYRCLQETW